MFRTAAVLLLAAFALPARADTNPFFDGVPATYTPGTPFSFTVRGGDLNGFAAYNVELVFTTVPPAGDQLSATAAPPADLATYPFPTADNFATAGAATGNQYRVTFGDSIFDPPAGVVATPFVNDALAVITVTPAATLTGPIRLSVDLETLSFRNTEGASLFTTPPTGEIVIGQGDGDVGAVPAPPAAVLGLVAAAGFAFRRRVIRRV